MAAPIQVTRLLQAIQQFEHVAPHDLPQGFMEQLQEVQRTLTDIAPETQSPGQREAAKVSPHEPPIKGSTNAGNPATGVALKYAARYADRPSPGQREVGLTQQIQRAASQIVENAKS